MSDILYISIQISATSRFTGYSSSDFGATPFEDTQHSRQLSEVDGKKRVGLLFDTAVVGLGLHIKLQSHLFVTQQRVKVGVKMHADRH